MKQGDEEVLSNHWAAVVKVIGFCPDYWSAPKEESWKAAAATEPTKTCSWPSVICPNRSAP